MGFSQRIGAEEGPGGFVSQQSHGESFWDARGIVHIDYLQQGKKSIVNIMPINYTGSQFKEKLTAFCWEDNAFPPRECKGVHVGSCYAED